MQGLFTVLLICFAISFVMQGWGNVLLFLGVLAVYTWFFKPTWKNKLKSWVSLPKRKIDSVTSDFKSNKRKKDVEKAFNSLKRK